MASDHTPLAPPGRRAWIAWVFVLIAVVLGLLALLVVWEDLSGRNRNATAWTTVFNLATGLFSLAGAWGYARRARWGPGVFELSVLGHIASHGLLLMSAIDAGRVSVAGVVGLALIPLLAAGVWVGMVWERRNTHA